MSTFKGITLNEYGKLEFTLKDYELRPVEDDEILVKVMASSINPSDLAFCKGTYGTGRPQLPRIVGGEGSGIIVDVGKNVSQDLIGKHVGILSSSQNPKSEGGVWAQYHYAQRHGVTVFDSTVDFDKICNVHVNPYTAGAFLEVVKLAGKTSVAHNAANSALGKMFIKLCVSNGIEVVNVVRKESSLEELTQIGGKHFIVTSEEGWEKKLKEKCHELDVSIFFDCVGGEVTGKCLSAIKAGGTLYNYGALEGRSIGNVSVGDLIFEDKSIKGLWLVKWMRTADPESVKHVKDLVKNDLENNNGSIFATEYKEIYGLDDFDKAIASYTTSSGKVLIKPWK